MAQSFFVPGAVNIQTNKEWVINAIKTATQIGIDTATDLTIAGVQDLAALGDANGNIFRRDITISSGATVTASDKVRIFCRDFTLDDSILVDAYNDITTNADTEGADSRYVLSTGATRPREGGGYTDGGGTHLGAAEGIRVVDSNNARFIAHWWVVHYLTDGFTSQFGIPATAAPPVFNLYGGSSFNANQDGGGAIEIYCQGDFDSDGSSINVRSAPSVGSADGAGGGMIGIVVFGDLLASATTLTLDIRPGGAAATGAGGGGYAAVLFGGTNSGTVTVENTQVGGEERGLGVVEKFREAVSNPTAI